MKLMKPKSGVKISWSVPFAYAMGLLVTDGSLSKDGRHFDFTSKDKDLVKIFSECLGLENKISKKISGYTGRKDYFHIQFGDVNFYKWCVDFGLMPNKSRALKNLKVPDNYFFDFLRGCFDGDGCIYAYWDPRWHSSYMFYIEFCSASLDFIKWMRNRIVFLLSHKGEIISSRSSATWQLRFAKKGSVSIFLRMFHSKNVPHLKRKFIKAQRIFKIENDHNKRPGGGTGIHNGPRSHAL